VTRRFEKNCPIFQKVAPKVSKAKEAKISTIKLNLKAQNIYIKPLFKPKNTYNKPCFETAYLGENVINLLQQKGTQDITIYLGYFIFFKIIRSLQKCPNWRKIAQFGHPGVQPSNASHCIGFTILPLKSRLVYSYWTYLKQDHLQPAKH
jgi:hypothetical protein